MHVNWVVVVEVVPHICIIPADNFCQVCQENASLILRAANLSEDEKMQRLIDAQHYLQFAKSQRQDYFKLASLAHESSLTTQPTSRGGLCKPVYDAR